MWGRVPLLPDVTSERAFQMQYGKPGMYLDLLVASMRLLVFLAPLIRACLAAATAKCWSAGVSAAMADSSPGWLSVAMQTSVLLAFAVLDQERYVLFRGPFSVTHRVIYALGAATNARPGECKYCHLYWHHRLLFTNTIAVLCRTPATAYWCGSVLCWLIQMMLQLADPQQNCGRDLGCAATAITTIAGKPALLLQQLPQPHNVTYGTIRWLELVVPGFMLTYLEYKARHHWLVAQQQQQQRGRRAAAAAAADTRVLEGSSEMQDERDKQQQQQQQGYEKGCNSYRQADIGTDPPSKHQQEVKQQGGTTATSRQSSNAAAISDTASAAAATGPSCSGQAGADSQVSPSLSPEPETECPETPSIRDQRSLAAVKQLAAAVAASIHQTHIGGHNHHNGSSDPTQNDLIPTAMIFGNANNSVPPRPRNGFLYGGAASAAAAAAGGGGVGLGRSALYVSPVRHQVMSFKFNSPLDTSPELFAQFKSELTALVHKHHATSGDPRPLVTNFSAFPGCQNIVISTAVLTPALVEDNSDQQQQQQQQQQASAIPNAPAGADRYDSTAQNDALGTQQQQEGQLQQRLQQKINSWLQDWPGWDLLSLQLHTAAAAVTIHPLVLADPSAATLPLLADCSNWGCVICRVAESSSTTARVQLKQSVVQRLQQQGYVSVRVVSVLQGSGEVVADLSWQLPAVLAADQTLEVQILDQKHQSNVLSLNSRSSELQNGLQVISMIVLAEQHSKSSSSGGGGGGVAESASLASNMHPMSVVLAESPVLLLPAAAACELQQLLAAAVRAGLTPDQAAREMQDLVRDMAAVISSQTFDTAIKAAQQVQYQAIWTALLQLFDEQGMRACVDILQHCTPYGPGSWPTADTGSSSSINAPEIQPDSQARPAGSQEGGGGGPRSSTSGISITSNSSSSTGSSSHTADDLETDSVAGRNPSWVERAAECIKQQLPGVCGTGEDSTEPAARATQLLAHRDIPADNLCVNWRTSLLGFNHQVPGLEGMYLSFKSKTLHTWDRGFFLWYLLILIVLSLQLAAQYLQGAQQQLLLFSMFRAENMLIDVLAHGLVLLSSYKGAMPFLQQWRSSVLVVALMLHVAIERGCLHHPASHAAMLQVVRRNRSSPLLWLSYHHIFKPFTFRVGELATCAYLVVMLYNHCLVDSAVGGWPRLWSWSMCLINVAVAWSLEVAMRRTFVRKLKDEQRHQPA